MPKFTRAKLAGIAVLVSALGVLPAATSATAASQPQPAQVSTGLMQAAKSKWELFHRTELYFGRGRGKDKPEVSNEEFQHFLDVEVTKRFEDGLTVLDANGQWKGSPTDPVTKEHSKLLILFYSCKDKQADGEIEEIRDAYKKTFEQQSVLRVDTFERVSF